MISSGKAGAYAPACAQLPRSLEVHLSTELHRARRVSARGLSKGAISNPGVDEPEVGMVEEVEGFRSHLETDVFAEPEVFHQTQIYFFHAWTQDVPSAAAAKVPLGRGEGTGGEPLGFGLDEVNGSHLIGSG